MDILGRQIIPGAEFDSFGRCPPSSRLPDTHHTIVGDIQAWMRDLSRRKMIWLHGPARVGKSAVMQTLAESESKSPTSILGATFFFSRSGKCDDPQRVFITIAYQLAVKYPPYRQYVIGLLATDPNVVRRSMAEQFKRFIVHPFAEKKLQGLDGTVMILLDGLDKCLDERAQCDVITLIGEFVLQYPASPPIWIIASRPEPYIRAAFSSSAVGQSYLDMEIPVDSAETCLSVGHYLRGGIGRVTQVPYVVPSIATSIAIGIAVVGVFRWCRWTLPFRPHNS